ncbi:DNA excision repair protein ERCC-1 [Chanos chanos]|uniref:DNA excision repair protein ERCC-1 n=1 Tax=Chanos chanos TaxID=29144 RepID=A0A6J2WEV6_CHACN|nr:DNA excision repair protein ERCC-1 [Chanos chanos]
MEKKRFNINLDDSAFTKERAPVTSLFKSSSKESQGETSSTQSAPQPIGQPLSYAEFVIQSKNHKASAPASGSERQKTVKGNSGEHGGRQTGDKPGARVGDVMSSAVPENPRIKTGNCEGLGSGDAVATTAGASEQHGQDVEEQLKKDEGQSSEGKGSVAPHLLGSGSSIIVSPRQRGNPILKFVRNVPWEFGDVVPDYVLGRTTCALYLSLRYHNLNPNYIHDRLKQLGQCFALRVLLVQVDVKDPHHALKELARICIMADCTLILAWSPEEAGRYLETYKSYEKKPADVLKEQVERDHLSKVTDCLTTVKSVNRTDVVTLLSTFSSLDGIINASKEELVLCPGLGPQKAKRLYDVLHQPFLKSKKMEG